MPSPSGEHLNHVNSQLAVYVEEKKLAFASCPLFVLGVTAPEHDWQIPAEAFGQAGEGAPVHAGGHHDI